MNEWRHVKLGLTTGVALMIAACSPAGEEPLPAREEGRVAASAQRFGAYDWDRGNAPIDVVIPTVVEKSLANIGAGDASVILYTTALTTGAWFDAIAPYHPTAKGIHSRIGRRPASEGVTNRNKNIAIMYASLRTLSSTQPSNVPAWRAMLESVGLDPDDDSTDESTPQGIGNTVGRAVIAARRDDGMNHLGDAGGRKYNLRPYADTTGYEPVNSPYEPIKDPSRWQPLVKDTGFGVFTAQKFVTPQWGGTKPYSVRSVAFARAARPTASDWKRHPEAYKAQVDEVLDFSANLDDHRKLVAEFFNHKFMSIGFVALHVTNQHHLNLDEFVHYDFLVNVATFDGGIAVWREKARWDTVRPVSAVRFLYPNRRLRAWGGPGRGTVSDIKGSEWEPYLSTADHPDYPSGSACFCAAHAQASRRYLGTDALDWSVPFARGSSVIEPGTTPAADMNIGWSSWTDFARECALSRLWSGVHFRAAIEEGAKLCKPMGDTAFELVQRHVAGNVP